MTGPIQVTPTPRPFQCERCGQVHDRCLGHKRDGNPCGRTTVNGLDVCLTHGASAPQVRAAGQRRVEQARAEQAVVTYGLPVDIEPLDALIEEIARTAGHVRWLAGVVSGLEERAITFGPTETQVTDSTVERARGNTRTATMAAGVNVWVDLYLRERQHLVNVCKVAIACGLAEREVELAESQGALIAGLLTAVFTDPKLALSADQQQMARSVVSAHLRALPRAA